MLHINCPYCGLRDEHEFSCGGEAHISRPRVHESLGHELSARELSDSDFADYLFYRENPKGLFLERWRHQAGCRQWFNVARDTHSHEIIEIYPIDRLPETKAAKQAFAQNKRRHSAAEKAARP